MRLGEVTEPIGPEVTDADLLAACEQVEVPPLLAAVAACTGDLSVLRPEYRPRAEQVFEPDGGIPPEQLAAARREAAAALARFRDGGSHPAPLSREALVELFEFLIGPATADYFELLCEELSPGGADLRAPAWRKEEVAPDTVFEVGIIGAGMSGLAAAHRLKQAGVPYVVLEKNAGVGGTWLENTYPGCRVDVANHLYSYTFAQTSEWPQYFSSQEVLLDYFRSVAAELHLTDHIRFEHEVREARWEEERSEWVVTALDRSGDEPVERTFFFQAVVSAVGQLNQPSYPEIAGRDAFAGTSFHSARWDHSVPLAGKRVAVVGTGASALQFVPPVAQEAAHVTVFQRTAPWLVPTPTYTDEIPDGLAFLLRHLPGLARWDRLWLFWRNHEGLLPMAVVDPDWPHQQRSVSEANELLRELLSLYLHIEFVEPELFEKVLPDYPPIAKRVIRDNGLWARTLTRDNVTLVTEPIAEITPHGITTADGVEHRADVIVYGTGFTASRFLTPMRVVGRGGVDLHERWDGDARAYLGMTVPGFPNLFLCYGPNTNIVINGSIIYFTELEVRYLVEAVRALLEGGHRAMDCREEVHDLYNAAIDEANASMAWGASSVNSWYKNEKGRVTQNWPYSLLEYWRRTRAVDLSDYLLT